MNDKLGRQDLVKRARELAALADNATPGPWKCYDKNSFPRFGACQHICTTLHHKVLREWQCGGDDLANARLIAAAPAMARLLAEMADELEEVRVRAAIEEALGKGGNDASV